MHALLKLAIAAGVLAAAPGLAFADDAPAAGTDTAAPAPAAAPAVPDLASLPPPGDWLPATSILEQPKYPAGFTHFNYVNPNAPKGGNVRLNASGQTFDTLNPILDKGTAADGLGLIYDTLMSQAVDELDIAGSYPDVANALRYPADLSYVTFRIDPNAKWHDGVPITADDVVWTFEKTVELNQFQRHYYQHVVKAVKTAPDQVTFIFDEKNDRELPNIMSQLQVLPQHWWEGKDASGNPRDIGKSTLEPPLGSGPYEVSDAIPGRSITYKRVPDFWGKDLPVYVGQYNFDTVTYEYFRDLDVAFQAFTADQLDYWDENQASRWATAYNFPAANDGRVKKEEVKLPQVSGVMNGFVPNLRRPLFQDVRVRQAFNLAFDFDSLNRTIFYGQYQHINSFFFGLPFASSGLPGPDELAILDPLKDKVPPSVFTTPYVAPDNSDPQKVRQNLMMAIDLMKQAGYTLQGDKMVDKNGKQVTVELLLVIPALERVALPYQQSLAKIGIQLNIRTPDSTTFDQRARTRDFDLITEAWGQSNSPGNEQIGMWGSQSADSDSSQNYAGIKDPAVDAIINHIIFNKGRDDQIAAVKALDRVLLANQYVIPTYTYIGDRIAYWNRFSHPEPYPKFAVDFLGAWWWDKDKAAKTGAQNGG